MIFNSMPIFCIDFLITCKDKYLLIKRKDEPLKNKYFVIGGRMLFNEKIEDAARRIQKREIGKYYSNFNEIGFSNYIFPKTKESRATHTPSLLFKISVSKIFNPLIDNENNSFIWSNKIPNELLKQTIFF